MRYKTTIEICTDADDKYEATDIAGELLRGAQVEGADLKVRTISLINSHRMKAVLIICAIAISSITYFVGNRVYVSIAKAERKPVTSYAIHPPLNTSVTETHGKEFKEIWQEKQKDRINSAAR